jgi:hypothetical protein
MAVTSSSEFQTYLEKITQKYQQSNMYTLTDAEGKIFDVGLMVQTWQPQQRQGIPGDGKQEKIERFPVLEGIRKYAANHVLLVGKPGSGKSTALQRLLWEEAQAIIQGEKRKIPVLLELRHCDTSVETLICKFLRKNKHRIEIHKEDSSYAAAIALGKLGRKEAIPTLLKYFRSPNPDFQDEFVSALERFDDEEIIQELISALNDKNYNVSLRAANALRKIASTKALSHLSQMCREGGEDIRHLQKLTMRCPKSL